MELNNALKIVLELAEQNMLNDADMYLEMKEQFDAIESVQMHLQELKNPSPIQVVLFTSGGSVHESISNVPASIIVLDEDTVGDGHIITLPSEDDTNYVVGYIPTECDPQRIATILSVAND
jgi:hypothetical protein